MNNDKIQKVYNLIILDESGSMQSIKEPIINGFNEIIQTIRNEATNNKKLQQWINFYSFNGSGIREQIPLSQVENPVALTTIRRFHLTRNNIGNQYYSWSIFTGFKWSRPPDFPI